MSILRNVLQDGDNSIHDIVSLNVGNDVFQFAVGDTSDLRLDVVEVLSIVRQKHLELFFSHGRPQLFNLGDEFIPDSPRKLVRDDIEITLKSSWSFFLRQFDYRIDQVNFVGLLFIF